MRPDRKMAGASLVVDPWPFLPTGSTIMADLITDTLSVIPNDMSGSIRRDSNPGAIIKTVC
jgi:hypothetical protein